jgi:hypothetical protein
MDHPSIAISMQPVYAYAHRSLQPHDGVAMFKGFVRNNSAKEGE